MTTDCTPRYCYADPVEGGKQAVAEAYRNLCAVGAKPLAITNCLNFGNPQRPEIMAQFVGCLEGMGEACLALDFPIVSGNVSLYNESKATDGGSSPSSRRRRSARSACSTIGRRVGDDRVQGARAKHLFVLGHPRWPCWAIALARGFATAAVKAPPPVDLGRRASERRMIRQLIAAVSSLPCTIFRRRCRIAVAEMALAGNVGADLCIHFGPRKIRIKKFLFGRIKAATSSRRNDAQKLQQHARTRPTIACEPIGFTGGEAIDRRTRLALSVPRRAALRA